MERSTSAMVDGVEVHRRVDKLVSTGQYRTIYWFLFYFILVCFCFILVVVGRRMWRRSRHHDSEFRMKIMKIMSLVLVLVRVGGVGPQRREGGRKERVWMSWGGLILISDSSSFGPNSGVLPYLIFRLPLFPFFFSLFFSPEDSHSPTKLLSSIHRREK